MSFQLKSKFFTKPKQLLKLIVLVACTVFAILQLEQCIKKIIHPPVTTYYNFQLNDTIRYPSVTICRRQAYKTDIFQKYGVRTTSDLNSRNAFLHFNFKNYTLQEFMNETTYDFGEIFGQYGYAGIGNNPNISVKSIYYLNRGACYTLTPDIPSDIFSIGGGYFFYFLHTETSRQIDQYGVSKYGFQIYLHDSNEILTFEDDQTDSYLEYLYVEASEDMRVVLNVQTFGRVSTSEQPCISDLTYSKSRCQEYCVHLQVAETAGCTLPWLLLPNNDSFPQCSDYESVRDLIADFRNSRANYLKNCSCPMSCNISVYSTKIMTRREMDEYNAPNSIISLYYSSNLVTNTNEVTGYDWNMFLADIGGSLGFLLGLSVIGLMTVVEEIFHIIFKWIFICKRKDTEETKAEENNIEGVSDICVKTAENGGHNNEDIMEFGAEKKNQNLNDCISIYNFYEQKLVEKKSNENNKIEKYACCFNSLLLVLLTTNTITYLIFSEYKGRKTLGINVVFVINLDKSKGK